MSKLPINFLLYVLILGLLGMSGWEFYLAITAEKQREGRPALNKEYQLIIERGKGRQQVVSGPDYAQKAYWDGFWAANFIGKLPPKPEAAKVEIKPEIKPELAQTPLEDILEIAAIISVSDVRDASASRVIVKYRPEANVRMPEAMRVANDAARKAQEAGAKAAAARSSRSSSNRNSNRNNRSGSRRPNASRRPSGVPTFGATDDMIHQIGPEGTLWPPYEHIRLVRVSADASRAWFVREDTSKPKEEWKEEPLWRVEFNLGQKMLDAVHKFRGKGLSGESRPTKGDSKPKVPSAWQPTKQTERIEGQRNAWNVGNDDLEFLRSDQGGRRLFNEELQLGQYTSRSGVRGVKVNKVSKRMQRFGIVRGDVIISLNGTPVKSKAEAMKVGKRLYKKGVRSFEVEFLSRGKRVVRSYVAPDK